MKITKSQLKQIIKEEIESVVQEGQAQAAAQLVQKQIQKGGSVAQAIENLGFKWATQTREGTQIFRKDFEDKTRGFIEIKHAAS